MEEDIQNYSQTVMFRGLPCNNARFTTVVPLNLNNVEENVFLTRKVLISLNFSNVLAK